MSRKPRSLAVIPARSGSKRLPGKNVALFCGRPLITWTIIAARQAKTVGRVIVSTECQNIARTAKQAGAEVPFLRPSIYATDDAKSISVLKHIVDTLGPEAYEFDGILLLQPTSPLRTSDHIDRASDLFFSRAPDSVISVTESGKGEGCTGFVDSSLAMTGFPLQETQEELGVVRQKFKLNGAIYLSEVSRLLENDTSDWGANRLGYHMAKEESVDIDTIEEFRMAERLMKMRIN